MSDSVAANPGARPARLSDAASLPVGPCPQCEREVLGYLLPDQNDAFACVHCDRPLRQVHWVDEDELTHVGYDAWDPLASDPLTSGCGTGCGSGGCGRR